MNTFSEINGYVELGVTTPVYAVVNQKHVVAKSIRNDDGYIALFNELLGYNLAKELGLRYPAFGYGFVDDAITDKSNAPFECNHNDLFTFTEHEIKVMQITSPKMVDKIPNSEILNVFIFDIFISNTDRNKGNILIVMPPKNGIPKLFPIDYTHILPGRCLWRDILRQSIPNPSETVGRVYDHGYHQFLIENKSFTVEEVKKCADVIKVKIDTIDFTVLISRIPNELLKNLTSDDIDLLVNFLEKQKEVYDDLIDELIKIIVR